MKPEKQLKVLNDNALRTGLEINLSKTVWYSNGIAATEYKSKNFKLNGI